MKLRRYIRQHRDWSFATFGEGRRVHGCTAHILKELLEFRASPTLEEAVDLIILGIDCAVRTGADPVEIVDALRAKQDENRNRPFRVDPSNPDAPVEAADARGKPRWKPREMVFDALDYRRIRAENPGGEWTFELIAMCPRDAVKRLGAIGIELAEHLDDMLAAEGK